MIKRAAGYFSDFAIFLLIMTTALLTGCGAPTEDSAPEAFAAEIETEASGEEAEGMQEGERQEGESREEIPAAASPEVSDREATVSYAGEAFIKSLFAAGGEMLWLYGVKDDGNFFLGYMGQEGDVFQETEVSPEVDMRAFHMAVDRQGRCHVLWMSVQKETVDGREFDRLTFDRSCITIVDSSGKTEKEIQVSDVFSEEQGRPFCFVVDEVGNYYFENGMQLVQILPDGTLGRTVSCAGPICGIGMGKSGSIYCSSEREGGATVLEKLEEGELRLCSAELPGANASYAGIYAGTDTELLLLNKDSGIFAVQDCGDNGEIRVSGTEMPVSGEKIGGYGILADGRACILSQTEGKETVFYYIPAGR